MPFIDHLVAAAQAAAPGAQVRVTGPTAVEVSGEGTQWIDAAQVEWQTRGQSEESVRAGCDVFVRSMLTASSTPADVPWDALRPLVRPGAWVTAVLSEAGQVRTEDGAPVEGAAPLHHVLNELLVLAVAIDRPDSMTVVSEAMVRGWGLPHTGPLFERALSNLARERTDQTFGWEQVDGVSLLRAEGPQGYETSWAALPDMIRGLAAPGEALVMLPTRNDLVVVPGTHLRHLEVALDAVGELYDEAPRRVARPAFVMTPGGLQLWRPPADQPLRRAQQLAVAMQARTDYQKLRDHVAQTGSPDLVPNVNAAGNDEKVVTYASLPADVIEAGGTVHVPAVVDEVVLVTLDHRTLLVPVDLLQQVCGRLPYSEGLLPLCLAVRTFPTEEQLQELSARSGMEITQA